MERNIKEQNHYIQILSRAEEQYKQIIGEKENQQQCIEQLNQGILAQNEYVNSLEENIKKQQEYIEYCEQQKKEVLIKKDKLEQENNINTQKIAEQKKLIDRQQEHLREQAFFINKVKRSLLGKMFFGA